MGGCRRRLDKNAERFPVARITQKRKKEQRRLGIGEHARERRGELFTPSAGVRARLGVQLRTARPGLVCPSPYGPTLCFSHGNVRAVARTETSSQDQEQVERVNSLRSSSGTARRRANCAFLLTLGPAWRNSRAFDRGVTNSR